MNIVSSNMIHIISENKFKSIFDDGELLNSSNYAPRTRFIVKLNGYEYPYLAINNLTGYSFHKMFLKLDEAINYLASGLKGCEA